MAKKDVYTDIDLHKNQLLRARLENLAAAPASPGYGQLYYDTVLDDGFIYLAVGWTSLTAGSSGGGAWGTITGTLSDQLDLQAALDDIYTEIDSQVDSEETARINADATLQNNINAEASARASADANLNLDITSEAISRALADSVISGNLTAETAARIAADAFLQANINAEAITRAANDVTIQNNLNAHIADQNNPHLTSLEQARAEDNFFSGEVDMNSNRLRNLPAPVNADEAVNKSYVDGLIDTTLKPPQAFTPAGTYPVTYNGNAIQKGDTFRTAAGSMGAITTEGEELLIALIDAPGQTDANWQCLESNRNQATTSLKGIAQIASQAQAENELSSNDSDIMTPQKTWFAFVRDKALAWTWALKQTFTTAPRFNSTTANHYLKVDGTKDLTSVANIPATDISEDITHRFATDAEKATWNAKQVAFTILTTLGNLANASGWLKNNGSGALSYTTPSKSDVGLGSVDNTSDAGKPVSTAQAAADAAVLASAQAYIDELPSTNLSNYYNFA